MPPLAVIGIVICFVVPAMFFVSLFLMQLPMSGIMQSIMLTGGLVIFGALFFFMTIYAAADL